jgi:hypothetical protein
MGYGTICGLLSHPKNGWEANRRQPVSGVFSDHRPRRDRGRDLGCAPFAFGVGAGGGRAGSMIPRTHLSDDPLRHVADRTAARINAALRREQSKPSAEVPPLQRPAG